MKNTNDLLRFNINKEIDNLYKITEKLKRNAIFIVTLLCVSLLLFCLIAIYKISYSYTFFTELKVFLIIFQYIVLFIGILLLFSYDSLKKRGLILYENLGDIYEEIRKIKLESSNYSIDNDLSNYEYDDKENKIKDSSLVIIQRCLKSFIKASDLPIVPGTAGQAFYISILILLSILGTLVLLM